jgi:hypothetical protein
MSGFADPWFRRRSLEYPLGMLLEEHDHAKK